MEGKTINESYLTFQDPAMNDWVSAQTMNEVSRDLRENYQTISNTTYFLLSIFIGILSTYFLSQKNWIVVLVLLILLELMSIPRLKYLKKRRRDLIATQNKVREFCRAKGLPIPKGYR